MRVSPASAGPAGGAALCCGHCGKRLADNGGSLDFCDVLCQEQWYAARSDRLPEVHGVLALPAALRVAAR